MGIWGRNHDVTVQWRHLGPGGDASHNFMALVGSESERVSFHHNLFFGGVYRQPAIGFDDSGRLSPDDTVGDVVNNLVWGYTAYGTTVVWQGTANVVGNCYQTSRYPGDDGRAIELTENAARLSAISL